MSLKDRILNYFAEKKSPIKQESLDLVKIGAELGNLMSSEDIDRLNAVFLEDYMADTYTLMPCNKMLNLSFGCSDDLTMVSKMLIDCAKAKHEQRVKNSFQSENLADKPYSVMLYDDKTKNIVGGLTVYQDGPHCVASVINERERQKTIQAIKAGKVM